MDRGVGSKRLVDVQAAAQYTGLSIHTIYTKASKKQIPHVKLGKRLMFDLGLLDRWIEQNTVMPMRQRQA